MAEDKKSNIYLCGFMATGKSSVGKRLADALRWEFLDMDALIEAKERRTISEIFSSQGEPAFRAMESRMVRLLSERSECVVATGGGAIVNPQNLEMMKHSGLVITLTADIPTILRRSAGEDTRPLLLAADRQERIATLLEQRAPFYAAADIILDTSLLSVDEVAAMLLQRLHECGFLK